MGFPGGFDSRLAWFSESAFQSRRAEFEHEHGLWPEGERGQRISLQQARRRRIAAQFDYLRFAASGLLDRPRAGWEFELGVDVADIRRREHRGVARQSAAVENQRVDGQADFRQRLF